MIDDHSSRLKINLIVLPSVVDGSPFEPWIKLSNRCVGDRFKVFCDDERLPIDIASAFFLQSKGKGRAARSMRLIDEIMWPTPVIFSFHLISPLVPIWVFSIVHLLVRGASLVLVFSFESHRKLDEKTVAMLYVRNSHCDASNYSTLLLDIRFDH